MAYSILTSECKQPRALFEKNNIKLVFEVTINIQSSAKWSLTANPNFVCNIYMPVCLQNRISFDVLMLASSTWLHGLVVLPNGTKGEFHPIWNLHSRVLPTYRIFIKLCRKIVYYMHVLIVSY